MSGRQLFSTETLAPRDRFPAFCEEVVRRYTRIDITTNDRAGFRATIEFQRAGAIGIGCLSTTQMNTARTRDLLRDGNDSLIVAMVKRGEAYQTRRGNALWLAPGDAIICDCAYPGELNFTTETAFWDLRIPRAKLAPLLPNFASFAGALLDQDGVARRLLFSYLAGTFSVDLFGGGPAVDLVEDHIIGLVSLALGAGSGSQEFAERHGVPAVRRAAVLHEIEIAMSDPNLTSVAVAARLGITPRYLRMLLEETGRSFSQHLLDQRLNRAFGLLRNPAQRRRRIADIAFACGFGDLSYFNRAFRRRHGATPSDVREASRHDDV